MIAWVVVRCFCAVEAKHFPTFSFVLPWIALGRFSADMSLQEERTIPPSPLLWRVPPWLQTTALSPLSLPACTTKKIPNTTLTEERPARCLVPQETTVIVSMVFSRSKVLEKEVFLFQRLDAERRGQMLHLKVGRRLHLP
jgi:hypothetical protein